MRFVAVMGARVNRLARSIGDEDGDIRLITVLEVSAEAVALAHDVTERHLAKEQACDHRQM